MAGLPLSEVHSIPDILDQVNFRVFFGNIPGAGANTRPLTIKCFTGVLPEVGTESITPVMHGYSVKYRGRKTYSNVMSFSFYEDSEGDTLKTLTKWKEFVVGTRTGNSGGYKAQYATSSVVEVLDTVGEVSLRYNVNNVYPETIQETSLSTESSAPVQVNVSFSLDYFEVDEVQQQ